MPVLLRCRLRRTRVDEERLVGLAQKILAASGEPDGELSLEIVGNKRIQDLNRRYRHQDRPTDVLAFPTREAPGPRTPLLGDVIISFQQAAEQATRYGHSIDEEFMTLLIHGTLHLLGYDHERGVHEAHRMHRKERSIMQTLRPLPTLFTVYPSRRQHTIKRSQFDTRDGRALPN